MPKTKMAPTGPTDPEDTIAFRYIAKKNVSEPHRPEDAIAFRI